MSLILRVLKSRQTRSDMYWIAGIDWAAGCSPDGTLAVMEEIELKGE